MNLHGLLVRLKTIVFGRTWVLLQMFIHFLKFSTRNLRDASADRPKFCTVVSTRPNFTYNAGPKFRGPTPEKFKGPKTCKIWPDFGRLWSSAANISGTNKDIQNQINILSTAILLALGETRPAKFDSVTLKISLWNRTHLKRLFRKTIFWPLGGDASPQFLHRLENDKVLLAHPLLGTGPFTIFFERGSIIGLKCSKCTSMTLTVMGIAPQHFITWRAAIWGW